MGFVTLDPKRKMGFIDHKALFGDGWFDFRVWVFWFKFVVSGLGAQAESWPSVCGTVFHMAEILATYFPNGSRLKP